MAATADDLLNALVDLKTAAQDQSRLMLDISKNLTYVEAAIENGKSGGDGSSGPRLKPGETTYKETNSDNKNPNAFQQIQGFRGSAKLASQFAREEIGAGAGAAVGVAGGLAVAGFAAFKFAEALKGAADDARRATDQLFQQMGRMGQVAPSLAMVFAERERNQIFRDRDVGEKVAGSARGLMSSENRINKASADVDALWMNVENTIQMAKNDLIATLMEPLNVMAKWANKSLFDSAEKEKPVRELGEWARLVDEQAMKSQERYKAELNAMRERGRAAIGGGR